MRVLISNAFARLLAVAVWVSFALSAAVADEAEGKPNRDKPKWRPTKRIWARDLLWIDAPKLEVKQWLTKQQELEGKYLEIGRKAKEKSK